MANAGPHLAGKIGLVLKAMNASRGRVALELGVDKSLVGRWVKGAVTPSEHNLGRLTDLVGRRLPGFKRANWELPDAAFAAAVGLPQLADWTSDSDSDAAIDPFRDGGLGVAARARHEAARYGQAYPGFYRLFRQSFSNSGTVLVGAVQILRQGDELFLRYSDGLLSYRGKLYILGCQVYGVLGECTERDMMMFLVINGVTANRALNLDGIVTTVSGDKSHTPISSIVLLLRQGELSEEGMRNEEVWRREVQAAHAANREGSAGTQLPPSLQNLLTCRVGIEGPDGSVDHVLRLPPNRSISSGIGAPIPETPV